MTGSASDDSDHDPSASACRICQCTSYECPDMPLIRPCRCSGSLAYVHIECLNQWRSTSVFAQSTCSTCNFKYKTKPKPFYSAVVSNRYFIWIASVMVSIVVTCLSGYVCMCIPTSTSNLEGQIHYHFGMADLIRSVLGITPYFNCDDALLCDPGPSSLDNPTGRTRFEYVFPYGFKSLCTAMCAPFYQYLGDCTQGKILLSQHLI
jgi:RING-variant domain